MKIKNIMLSNHTIAITTVILASSHAYAADQASNANQQPPLSVQAEMNLGQAGLMSAFTENDQYGTVQWRIGQGRNTVGSAQSSPTKLKYKDATSDTVVPLAIQHMLPDGKSALRLSVNGTFSNGADNTVQLDGNIWRADAQYLLFPNVNTLLSFGVFGSRTDMDLVGVGSFDRKGGGLRFDALHKFSEHWGTSFRGEYSWGNSTLITAAGPFTNTHTQGDDHLYLQSELVGQFHKSDLNILPKDWTFHPVLGLQLQRDFLERTTDSLGSYEAGVVGSTEDYGTLWGHLRFEKNAPPSTWTPNVIVGLEHEYVNDLDEYTSEPTYGVFGGGISMTQRSGTRYELAYLRHQGFKSVRSNQSLVLIGSWNL